VQPVLRSDVLVSEATAALLVLPGSPAGFLGVAVEEAVEKNKMATVLEKAAFGAEGLGFAQEGVSGSGMVVDKLAVGEVLEKAAFGAEGLGFAQEGASGSGMVVDKLAVGEVLECTSEVVVGRILAAGVEDMVAGWE